MATAEANAEAVSKDTPLRLTAPAGDLIAMLEPLAQLVTETRMHVSEDGLVMPMVDPANVGMVKVNAPASAFDTFETHTDLELGFNLSRVMDLLSIPESDDRVTVTFDSERRKLRVEGERGFEATLALIDPDSIRESAEQPDLDLPAEIVIEPDHLEQARRAADMVSDHICFGVDPDEEVFFASAEGDTDDVKLELERDDLVDLTAEKARSLYSLDYVTDIAKPIPSDTEVTIELGEEFPMLLSYDLLDGQVSVETMIAPRIQSE